MPPKLERTERTVMLKLRLPESMKRWLLERPEGAAEYIRQLVKPHMRR
jgi:hypothetical protein